MKPLGNVKIFRKFNGIEEITLIKNDRFKTKKIYIEYA